MTNIIVLDFDDTICIHPENDKSNIQNGKPNVKLINKINEFTDLGYEIHIYTSRGHLSTNSRTDAEKKYRYVIEEWLKKYKVKYKLLSFQKPFAMYYIDDKAIRPDEIDKLNLTVI